MFEVRYTVQSNGAIQFKQYNLKNLGGIPVQVRNVCLRLRCNVCRSDLPLFVFMRHTNDTCPCAKHSNAQVTDEARKALEELFFMYGNAEEIDKSLWQIIVAAISSKDLDHLPGFERANYLCLYKDLSTLIKLLKPNA